MGGKPPYIYLMTRLTHAPALAFSVALLTAPVHAQEDERGLSLMEEGMKLFFKGLMSEMEPAIEELEGLAREVEPALRNFLTEMGPALRGILEEVEDWSAYHPPEILPNGDIIIRRKTPADAPEGDEIEL